MAMTGAGMSAALKSAIEGVFDIEDETILQKFCDAVGPAIVTYIQANAQVEPGTFTTATGGDVTGLGGPIE